MNASPINHSKTVISEPPPLDDYPVDVEEDLKEGFDIDLNDSELPELPNDLNEFEQHSSNTTDAEIIPDCFDRPSQETSTLGNETPFQKLVKQDEPTAETTSVTISQSDLNIEKDEFFEFNSGPAIVEPTGGNQQEDFIKSLPVLTKPFNNAPIQESLGQLNNNIDDIEVDKSNSISNSGDDLDQTEERPESKEINSSFELEDLDFIIPVEGAIPLSKAQENHDDFSDFNDFKSAPVTENVECEVQVFEPQIVQPQAVSFEANFASFGESGETSMDDFDDFQDFSSTQEHSYESKLQVREFEAEDDDDFGDFSDFKQTAQIPTNEINQESFFRKDNLVSVLDMMFPKLSTDTETVDFQNNELNQSEIIRNLNNFDTSKALGYQYNSSRSSQTLVKALGIDTRNIVSYY